ncbi:MAG: dTMP kinase [Acidimicrobiales bacterium]
MARRGRYVALEGPEGCGKSTVAAALAARWGALATREPGGTPASEAIRSVVLDPALPAMGPRTEALLMAASRAQLVAEVIEPALAAGRDVVSDRTVYSSLAYQAYGRGLPLEEIRRVNDWAIAGRWPDVAILLDAPEDVLAARRAARRAALDRLEAEDAGFHARVRAGFAALAAAEPARWIVVDARGPLASVVEAVAAAVEARWSA